VGDAVLDVDEAVFDVVEQIPPGRVTTYGAVGRLVGVGPRRVARALSSGGGAVPWFRVVRADGTAAEPVRARQLELLAAEGVPLRNGRIDLAAVGWPDRDTDVLPGHVVPRDEAPSSTIVSRDDAGGRRRTMG
jgi:alkylated DNA nucleotide flippase Atl1